MLLDLQERLNEEIGTLMKHGADKRLAQVMSGLFGHLGYSPLTGNLSQRVEQADDSLGFQYLSFAMLLKGETEKARQYMRRSVELDPERATHGRQLILDNLEKVQEIVTASRTDFDKLRTEKYGSRPLEEYLV